MAMWVEGLLRRERTLAAAGLGLLCLLAWAWLLAGAGMGAALWSHPPGAAPAMAGMDMGELEAGSLRWPANVWLTTIAMWWAMMVAMMIPSAAATILLYGRVHRHASGEEGELAPTGAFAAGYVLVWLGFSILAAGLHWALQDA